MGKEKGRSKNMKKICCLIYLVSVCFLGFSQIDTVLLSQRAVHLFPSFPIKSSYTSLFDRRAGFEFAYSANMESGLGIYDISNPNAINSVLNLGISVFNNLDVSTLEQRNNLLFVGIGDFQNNANPASGLAILDISDPLNPGIKDIWDSTFFTHGISHLLLEGDFAYLSTMSDGLIILNIADPNNIIFKSHIGLDLNFPAPSLNAHNARGLKMKNDTLYICFDRGGLRAIDVSDKTNPVEVYKYINPILNGQAAAAYNDIAIKGNYAFVSVDYCGLEILDISSIPFVSVKWFNPWGCNFGNWSGADLHTNEVMLANNDSLLFVTGGQSELFVFDVTDPGNTKKTGEFVNLTDTLATHGLDVFGNKVILSFLHTPAHIPPLTPFFADPGGLKIVDYQVQTLVHINETVFDEEKQIKIFPNPTTNRSVTIQSQIAFRHLRLSNAMGETLQNIELSNQRMYDLELSTLPEGLYLLTLTTAKGMFSKRLLIQN